VKPVAQFISGAFGEQYLILIRTRLIILFLLSASLAFESCTKDATPIAQNPPETFNVPAVDDIVMYEINPGAFSSSQNFQGIIDRLDSIKALGVNTIWLMPIYPVGIVNSFGSPYCVRNYTEVSTMLGTLQDLQSLVSKAHDKKIAVILDWVANHTSWDNTWITNKDWYTLDADSNIISPAGTNWNDVADLNYDSGDMRLAMIAAMKYWVENADIDGFRCDAADYVPFDFWQQAIDSLHTMHGKNLILLAEGSRADHFTAGFQMNFSWDFLNSLKNVFTGNDDVSTLFTTNSAEYASVPAGNRKLRFTTNHDETNVATPITVFNGKDGALAASVITIYLEGVPLIYCGQEVAVSSPSVYQGNGPINWTLNGDMLSACKQLLNFYNSSNAARKGTLETFSDANVAIFKKSYDTEQILVIVNTRLNTTSFTVPLPLQGNWVNALTGSGITLPDIFTLSPYQYLVLRK
jgi:glycosidase